MTYSVPRASAIAFGVAAFVSLSALSAARADSIYASAYAKGPRDGPKLRADNRVRSFAQRAGHNARLGGSRASWAKGRSAERRAPLSPPLRAALCMAERASLLSREPRRHGRDGSGWRGRRSRFDRRLSVLLLPELRLLLRPRAVPVLTRTASEGGWPRRFGRSAGVCPRAPSAAGYDAANRIGGYAAASSRSTSFTRSRR